MTFYIISFLLSGKFASWRDPFTVATAKSYLYPSNTNIIGILGAALGISKEQELIKLQRKIYGVGVQGIFNNKTFTDRRMFIERLYNYSHLEPDRIKTIQTWEYIVNPMYKIIVIVENKEFAKRLMQFLENPEYPIYLGRSEFVGKIEHVELKEKEKLDRISNIRNTHIDIKIIPKEKATIFMTKKLLRYSTKQKLYNQKLLKNFYEIIGEVTLKEEKIGVGYIPISVIEQ